MNFGIPVKSMELIINCLKQKEEIEKACIFGSRSMGNYKNGSDVDIALYGSNITHEVLSRVNRELNEILPLPYYFDVVHYDGLKHDGLREHIDKLGKIFYSKE